MENRMVTDKQVRRLFMEANKQKSKSLAAAKAGMDEKTARKYLKSGKLPGQLKTPRLYRTREDAFEDIWEDVSSKLEINPGLEATTLFNYLQLQNPGKYSDGQLRSFQRKVKNWRALEGPGKEVYFPQQHHPGELSASDFTHMGSLGVTINGEPFDHLMHHFVLVYSNWETGTICFSESFESLSQGIQNGFWELGGVTRSHRSDSLSAAVHKDCNAEEFTSRYRALLNHYKVKGEKTNPGKAHENGDAEKSHDIFKKAVDQSLMLRGSRDFESRKAYAEFIEKIFSQLNSGRRERFLEECKHLRSLPALRLDDFKVEKVRVRKSSTISVGHNTYSLSSRLIGEMVNVRLYAETLEVWYGDKKLDSFPRLRGKGNHHIQYRHIIDWLLRKPGAFKNYRYRDDLFPTTRFRMAYDYLCDVMSKPQKASKEYLKILNLAAKESETKVDDALRLLFESGAGAGADTDTDTDTGEGVVIDFDSVRMIVQSDQRVPSPHEVTVSSIDLRLYDQLIVDGNSHRNRCLVSLAPYK
jgi:hypothetical protein